MAWACLITPQPLTQPLEAKTKKAAPVSRNGPNLLIYLVRIGDLNPTRLLPLAHQASGTAGLTEPALGKNIGTAASASLKRMLPA
jgi:hypothetical protein